MRDKIHGVKAPSEEGWRLQKRRDRREALVLGSIFGSLILAGVILLGSVLAIVAGFAVWLWQVVL